MKSRRWLSRTATGSEEIDQSRVVELYPTNADLICMEMDIACRAQYKVAIENRENGAAQRNTNEA